MHRLIGLLVAALGAATASSVWSAGIERVTPQGEVAQVRQVVVRFTEPVITLGDPRRPDPVSVACEGGAATGTGRWADGRTWLYDFATTLPPGVRCSVSLRTDFTPLAGKLSAAAAYTFSTGGPAVTAVRPWEGATIEEDQHFLLQLSGAAQERSVLAAARCEVEGIGEALPVRIVVGAVREEVLRARGIRQQPERWLLLACGRPLPNDVRMRLAWGRGIAALANARIVTSVEQRFEFTVRKAFSADFSCERERSSAPCLPIRPLALRWSSPVPRALAEQVRLQPAGGAAAIAPRFDKDDRAAEVSEVAFPAPLPENTRFTLLLPAQMKDTAGRVLANAASYPLSVATGEAPPIAKFAAAPFGVVEWTADAAVPLTLRHVQADLQPAATGGLLRVKRLRSDADMLQWFARVQRLHETQLSARELGLPQKDWFTTEFDTDAKGRRVERKTERHVATREVSLLAGEADAQRLDLPVLAGSAARPMEVIGVPLAGPGLHVLEVESQRLGRALLDKPAPMYVRTAVLATNLGVHFKWGRENSVVWVTSLDRGRPVPGADLAVYDCKGQRLWAGRSDAQGLATVPLALQAPENCDEARDFFVTARRTDAQGVVDVAFVFSGWNKGIEPWRFNLPIGRGAAPDPVAHTVFDRTLLRAGQTVSMKHFMRLQTGTGLADLDAAALPTQVKIVHDGSGQEFSQPLAWSGTRHAVSTWNIPGAARLGEYRVRLVRETGPQGQRRDWPAGSFRVEEFRVPLVDARLSAPKQPVVAPAAVPIAVQMNYLSGGGMGALPLTASALLRSRSPSFAGYEDYSFEPPHEPRRSAPTEQEDEPAAGDDGRLVADKLVLRTDANGAASVLFDKLPAITRASELSAELSFPDPNGEVQTVATTVPLWPSGVVPGIRTGAWASGRGEVSFGAVALDTAGRPLQGQAIEVRGRLAQTISSRKRVVGGFYAYDNRTEYRDLGLLCSGASDERGQLACTTRLEAAGEVELIVGVKDAAGHIAQAAASVWVTRQGELWFAQDNDDRIDLLPEKQRYEPGQTARLQLRMPYREATALLAVEREGVISTRVISLRGDDPTIELKIDPAWAPNVYVSVLALRGRIRQVPWYSLFTWGWREPLSWARAFVHENREWRAPTAMVDLARPSFKLGATQLRVGSAAHELQVAVSADQAQYPVRGKAMVRVKVTQGGKPLPAGQAPQIAFAAVDEGLLALRANTSWDLLSGMLREREWGVETSTAQGEIIGRRHYGRKAVAAGGGGGRGGTRELFDTLLLWRAVVPLDADGQALIEVPLNDSLTSFRLVAVADAGTGLFGSGSTSIRVTQDLQLLSGLPPLVREGDRFSAMLTVRNTTAREMKLRATLVGTAMSGAQITRTPLELPAQQLALAAGGAQLLTWPVAVPAQAFGITWEAAVAEEGGGRAADRMKIHQLVTAAVPLRVLQATLVQLDGTASMPVSAPADALPAEGSAARRGGLLVGLQPSLGGALPGMRRYFETYPFSCLEQKASKAIGLRDAALWATLAEALPTYLDSDGLANYFPPRAEDGPRGSDRLTAYVVAAAHEAGFELPADTRARMLDGLVAFVEGRIERRFWSPRADLDVRKLAALEALSRHGRVQPRMLGSIVVAPNTWPTAAVIDWLSILRRVEAMPERARRLEQAQQILRARLSYTGTTLRFSNEDDDFWWWLMDSADANAARLMLAVMDEPAWRDDLPRMVVGSLARQRRGAWLTTTANLWGSLALDRFSAKFEAQKIGGSTRATIDGPGAVPRTVAWAGSPEGGSLTLPWPADAGSLQVVHEGSGKPWLSVQSLAAVPLRAPLRAGYSVVRSVSAVQRKTPGMWSRGDLLRVRLEIDAQADMTWVVVSDPVPGGASIQGTGLARDSALATRGERREGGVRPAYEERGLEAFRGYYEMLPRGRHVLEYTLRLNNAGLFQLPPTRVEAMYAPESFGELPNAPMEVQP